MHIIIIIHGSGVAMAEKLQGLGEKYPKFYFLTYWVHSFYSVLYLVWKAWRYICMILIMLICNPDREIFYSNDSKSTKHLIYIVLAAWTTSIE